jgi:hypothetical protein
MKDLTHYIKQHQTLENKLFNELVNPAEEQVREIKDYAEQQDEIKKINCVVDYCNYTNQLITHLFQLYISSPSQDELMKLRTYKRMADKYIRLLGGNPSTLTFIKETDL